MSVGGCHEPSPTYILSSKCHRSLWPRSHSKQTPAESHKFVQLIQRVEIFTKASLSHWSTAPCSSSRVRCHRTRSAGPVLCRAQSALLSRGEGESVESGLVPDAARKPFGQRPPITVYCRSDVTSLAFVGVWVRERRKRGTGGRVLPIEKSAGDVPQKLGYFNDFLLTRDSCFAFSNIKIKCPKSEEKLNFGGRWVWVPMNLSYPIKTSWRRPCLGVTENAHCTWAELRISYAGISDSWRNGNVVLERGRR